MRKFTFLIGVLVFVFAIQSKSSFSQQVVNSADIFVTPSSNFNFFAGLIGGYDDPNDAGLLERDIDWSLVI